MYYNKLFSSPELTVKVKFSDDKMSGVFMSMVSLHLYMMFDDKLLGDHSDNADLMCINQWRFNLFPWKSIQSFTFHGKAIYENW